MIPDDDLSIYFSGNGHIQSAKKPSWSCPQPPIAIRSGRSSSEGSYQKIQFEATNRATGLRHGTKYIGPSRGSNLP